jgi:ABC-type polysaccharide/polyol phosphate export permease
MSDRVSRWRPRASSVRRASRLAEPRPRTSIWSQRSLIWNFARRDLKSRFKGTAFGWAWSLMVPLATVVTYSVVFSVIFRSTPPDFGSGRPGNFTVWLMVGLVPWTFFLIAINIAIPTLLSNGPMMQKIYFPSYAPVLGATLAVLVQTTIEFGILGVILVLFGEIGPTWLLFPVWLGLFVLFVNGVASSLAILNVYARDLAHITAVILQLLFFLTPIIYPITLVPERWHGLPLRTLVEANPLSQFVDALRALVYGLELPALTNWLFMLAWTTLAVSIAAIVYQRRGQDIGEAI